jgi:hypothetical protein
MDHSLKQFKARVLAKPEVREAYDRLEGAFAG